METKTRQELEIDILKKDLENRFTEIMFHSQRYHTQVNLVYLYLSAVVTVGAAFYTEAAQKIFQNIPSDSLRIVYAVVLVLGAVIQYYLGALMLDALYMIYANGARIASIEKKINDRLETNILQWDSEIIPQMYDAKIWHYKTWVKPTYIVSAWILLIWIITSIGLVTIWYFAVKVSFSVFLLCVCFGTFFHVYQWALLHFAGREFLSKVIYKMDLDTQKSFPKISISIKFVAPFLTLALGIIPFSILSIQTNSFWLNTLYDFPLITLPTIWLGDLIVLPIFNFLFVDMFNYAKKTIGKRTLLRTIIISTIVSLFVNSYTHYLWVHDQYTGFMDTQLGHLSLAGWWHYGFSILQMSIVFIFVICWFMSIKRARHDILKNFERAWIVFVIFTSLSILDFLSKSVLIFHTPIIGGSVLRELGSFTTLILSIFVLLIGRARRVKKESRKSKR